MYVCVCVCVCARARAHACVCIYIGSGQCLITNLCLLISCALMSVAFNLSMKCTRLGPV